MPVGYGYCVLPGSSHDDCLLHAVCHEVQPVEDVERQIAVCRINMSLHKDKDAVFTTHLNIGEFLTRSAVDVQEKTGAFRRSVEIYSFDEQLLLMAVVDEEAFCGCRFAREDGVEAQRVGGKSQRVAFVGCEAILNA